MQALLGGWQHRSDVPDVPAVRGFSPLPV